MEVSTEKPNIQSNSRRQHQCRYYHEQPGARGCKRNQFKVPWSNPVQGWHLLNIRITSAMVAIARSNRIWQCNIICFAHKFKLYKSLVNSILLISCETCILLDSWLWKKRIQAFKINYMRKLLHYISYLGHKSNNWVQGKIKFLESPQESLLATVKRRKLAWPVQACHRHDSLSKTILWGTLEGGQCHDRQR